MNDCWCDFAGDLRTRIVPTTNWLAWWSHVIVVQCACVLGLSHVCFILENCYSTASESWVCWGPKWIYDKALIVETHFSFFFWGMSFESRTNWSDTRPTGYIFMGFSVSEMFWKSLNSKFWFQSNKSLQLCCATNQSLIEITNQLWAASRIVTNLQTNKNAT